MAALVSLKAVVDEMDVVSDEHFAYLNPQTGELLTLSTEEISSVEENLPTDDYPEWQQALISKARDVLASNDYLRLPTRYDIHEYAIMEQFCSSLTDERLAQTLLNQIHGSGAFRRFKQTIHRYGVEQEWYRYRAAALEAIAIAWLESHHIPYQQTSS